ncbi:MAG TPA: aminopeptidase, partial [Bacillota bacterium]|nr:aminopeptidase [Bacillota bacterium]
ARSGEDVLVIMDKGTRTVGMALFEAAVSLGCEAMVVEIIPRKMNGEEPPEPVGEMMKHVDIVLAPTSKSITHTVARGNACKAGARVATLPGITEDCMTRALVADYDEVAKRAEKYARILTDGKIVRITNADGTDISMSLEGRVGMADTGIYRDPGQSGNLPAGEAFIAPVEGTANGVFVADGAMAGPEFAGTKIRITVANGYATSIEGGEAARTIEKMISPLGMPARNIAELGIGVNDRAKITGQVLEDEKVMGTIHIALGDNSNFGGNVRVASHLDGIVVAPTVEVDGVVIMDSGKFTH